ncbi:hypothetical protein, partial [Klebsiella pneumoniae]|uniref:hypothetical protein n=1 Tax=Klebsiella pneumoniae TaxID=573 RepID=UPI001C4EE6C5
ITYSRYRFVQKTVLAWDNFRFPSGPQNTFTLSTKICLFTVCENIILGSSEESDKRSFHNKQVEL